MSRSTSSSDPPPTSPRPPSEARRELLAIQKRLWRRLQREIEASVEDDPPSIAIYREEYARDVRRYQAISSKAELLEAAVGAGVVYVGDYHTLPQAQRTLVKLLLGLSQRRPEVVLCLEMVEARHQAVLDRYMEGRIGEERFLQEIHYRETWGFPWPPYREIFRVARRRGMRVVAINSDPRDHDRDHLLERDFEAARLIAAEMRERPEALVVVFDGDLHVARDHLPLIVDTVLKQERLPARRRLIVHQNAEEIYWQLARDRREGDVNLVRLAEDAFCVLNASPFEKLHSYLNWVSEREQLEPPPSHSSWTLEEEEPDLPPARALPGAEDEDGDEDDDEDDDDDLDEEDPDDDEGPDLSADYAEQVVQVIGTVARFLGIQRDDLDSFQLFTVHDLDFFDFLAETGEFTEPQLADVKRQILSNESYFIPKGRVIYLSDFSLVNAAEEGTHFLHYLCSGYDWERPRDLAADFYFRCATEALGFFGSKVVVPTRECWTERDCEVFVELERRRGRRRRVRRPAEEEDEEGEGAATQRVRILRGRSTALRASRLVLQHKRLEREFLANGRWGSAGRALTQATDVHLTLTHMLGHMLGDKLYYGLLAGLFDKARIRELFHARLDRRGVALQVYQEMVRLTAPVARLHARGERL